MLCTSGQTMSHILRGRQGNEDTRQTTIHETQTLSGYARPLAASHGTSVPTNACNQGQTVTEKMRLLIEMLYKYINENYFNEQSR